VGPPLVSRETELAELVEATTYGSGAVLSGPAGVGKTALANAIAKHVSTKGGRVEWVVATDASRSIPFGALGALLPGDVDERHPALVLGAIIRRQRELDERKLGLIVVDDAHLLDDHSAATLLGLVTAGAGRVVATVRSGEAAPDAVGALWKDGFLARCEVGPFARAATARFAESCLGGEVAAGTASLLWQHTQGNALFLSELIRQARADNRLADEHGVWMWRGDMTVPPRLADLLDRRFDRLGPAALDALGALVLGEPLSLSMLTDVVSIDGIA
jgi:predicted ATPase